MEKDSSSPKINDPMGLDALAAVIDRLRALKAESEKQPSADKRFALIVEQLEDQFASVQQKYDLLKDRYSLLKRSNAALCDELVWLRDQLDDLSISGGTNENK
ncbi:MAG: hypothetical protein JXX14_03775 [Deltaproteobacteria bacterium]|nr:hypothetical protein [Deltaproteobacteria bacterium]